MVSRSVLSVLLACALLHLANAVPAPAPQVVKAPRFKACKRSQPAAKLNECVRDSLQKSVPELVRGLPEAGVFSIDPLRVESLVVPQGKGAVSVKLSFSNLDISGLKKVKVRSAEMDVDKLKLKFSIEVERIELLGDYIVDGKVLILPITGNGRCNITLMNVKADVTEMLAKPVMKKGKMHAQVTRLNLVVRNTDRVYFVLENLFNGNKELGNNMNAVLNDNWEEVYKDMIDPVQSALGMAFQYIGNRLVSRVPYSEIFPE